MRDIPAQRIQFANLWAIQAEYEGGIQVFCEQLSHHPPISCWDVIDPHKRFRFTGFGHITATTRTNSVKAQQKGDSSVYFYEDGATVCGMSF